MIALNTNQPINQSIS